jgi:hypothetical protein
MKCDVCGQEWNGVDHVCDDCISRMWEERTRLKRRERIAEAIRIYIMLHGERGKVWNTAKQ